MLSLTGGVIGNRLFLGGSWLSLPRLLLSDSALPLVRLENGLRCGKFDSELLGGFFNGNLS